MAKHRLTNLVIDEVSSVDKGAGEGVRVVLAKRDTSTLTPITEATTIEEATAAVNAEIAGVLADAAVTDKAGAIAKSLAQFTDHIAGLAPDKTEKAAMPMTAAEQAALEKQIADTVTKAVAPLTAQIAKLDAENAFLKMAPAYQEFAKAFSEEDKKKFAAKTDKEKDEEMAEAKKRAETTIDPEIKKRLDQAEADSKVLKALLEKDEIATFAKRATDLGLPASTGEIMRKAYGGDAAAQAEMDKQIKALTEQVKVGKVFDEFGSGGPGKEGQTAYDEITAKAEELRKTADGAKLTPAQARVRVMEDPANAELMKRHNAERVQKLNRVAA